MRKKQVIIITIILITIIYGMMLLSGCFSKTVELKNTNGSSLNSSLNNTNNSLSQKLDLPHIMRKAGKFDINSTVYMNFSMLPVYRGVFGKNDSINLQLQQIGKSRQNVTTEEEAPEAARKALEPYGGLPADAVYQGADITYDEIYNYTLNKTTYKEPMFVTVFYSREINEMSVRGDSNVIMVTLGTKGELLRIFKLGCAVSKSSTGSLPNACTSSSISPATCRVTLFWLSWDRISTPGSLPTSVQPTPPVKPRSIPNSSILLIPLPGNGSGTLVTAYIPLNRTPCIPTKNPGSTR